MQRHVTRGIAAMLSLLVVTVAPACSKDGEPEGDKPVAKQAESGPVEPAASEPAAATTQAAMTTGGTAGAGEAAADTAAADTSVAEPGTAEPAVPEANPADAIPGLFAQAEDLKVDDALAKTALVDAIAAGATKIDAAKLANKRGEALMADGEGERAVPFFEWAAETHTLFSEPVYNLATLAAYAGELDLAKEHLTELKKRGNKKLIKKIGVDPAFALLADDPEVRKLYE